MFAGDVTNLAAAYKALGGGWEQRLGQDFVSEQNRAQMQGRTDWGDLLQPNEAPETIDLPPTQDGRLFNRPDW